MMVQACHSLVDSLDKGYRTKSVAINADGTS